MTSQYAGHGFFTFSHTSRSCSNACSNGCTIVALRPHQTRGATAGTGPDLQAHDPRARAPPTRDTKPTPATTGTGTNTCDYFLPVPLPFFVGSTNTQSPPFGVGGSVFPFGTSPRCRPSGACAAQKAAPPPQAIP